MKKLLILSLVVVAAIIFAFFYTNDEPDTTLEDVTVSEPAMGATVVSPLTIRGEARGPWYFEGDFPVSIENANGVVLGRYYATAQGEWMTEDFVPFSAELLFAPSQTETGTLVLEKDNPSGLPEHADERRIPIRFAVDWEIATTTEDVSFSYPATLGTSYVSTVDWPPQIQVLDVPYTCTEAGEETARAGRTMERKIGSQTVCVTVVAEGAAGSVYRQYAYSLPVGGETLSFTFSLQFPQCANYDDPQRVACEFEQANFSLDAVMEQLFASLSGV